MADAAGAEAKDPPRPTASDGAPTRASVPPPPVEQQQQPAAAPLLPADGSAAAQSCGDGDGGDDDEQVERFYALLANIRALRGLCSAGGDAAGRGRKRAREAEALWRPAFRMEDFEEEVSLRHQGKGAALKQGTSTATGSAGGGGKRPAATRARAAVDAANDREEDEVAAGEARGRGLGRRVAARG